MISLHFYVQGVQISDLLLYIHSHLLSRAHQEEILSWLKISTNTLIYIYTWKLIIDTCKLMVIQLGSY